MVRAITCSCSVLVVVVLVLLVCIPYTLAQNPGGCSPLPPNTLISGGPSGALRSNNVPNIETLIVPTSLFRPAVGPQGTDPWSVFSETQVRQHGLWCQVQQANTNNMADSNIGDWYYPTPSGLLALDNINNDSTPYQELKCDNQVGLVVDGEIVNNQGIVRCTTNITGLTTITGLNTGVNYMAVYMDNVFELLRSTGPTVYSYMKFTLLHTRDFGPNVQFRLSFNVSFGLPSRISCTRGGTTVLSGRGFVSGVNYDVIRPLYFSSSLPDVTQVSFEQIQPRRGATYSCTVYVEGRTNIASATTYDFDLLGTGTSTVIITVAGTPTGVTATTIGYNYVLVSWTAPSPPPAGYEVFYQTTSDATRLSVGNTTSTTMTVTGLIRGVTYRIFVVSFGAEGAPVLPSAHSIAAEITIPGCNVEGAVRLVRGRSSSEGRVDYCSGGAWGTVCDTTWNANSAAVVCRQLGYATTGVTPLYNSRFQYGGQVGSFSTLLMCAGDETNVSSCNVTFLTSCSAFDYAGVRCSENCAIEGDLRLVGGQNLLQGTVQICVGGVWGTVCGDGFGTPDAQVICRQLGLATTGVQIMIGLEGSGPIHFSNVNCIGNETNLLNCTYLTTHNCEHYRDAGVICTAELCSIEGSMRLMEGQNNYEGRVEICTSGIWSTVCDDFWGTLDAQVVCRQLGYSTEGVVALSDAYFGQGYGPILVDNFHCNGSELSLLDCKHLNQSNCRHNDDAGVRCQASSTRCVEGDIRLVGGLVSQLEGRVEICLNSVWGTICADHWSIESAMVVCRQLGYGTAGAFPLSGSFFGEVTGPIQFNNNVNCIGSESALIQCKVNYPDIIPSCSSRYSYNVGVICSKTENCTDGDLRLVDGRSPNEGRVEICYDRQWGTVCGVHWDSHDAQVACRKLGYKSMGATALKYAYFGEGTGPILIDQFRCTGSESSLIQCSHSTRTQSCRHSFDAGLRCLESCTVEGAVRLVGGQSSNEGRVEYCSGGVWSSVCDTTWDANGAAVVCRQLGYAATGITPVYNASFGQGAGPVIIDTVICRGNETDINNCTLTTPSSCSHSKDAGVKCSEYCITEGDLELVGGQNHLQGTVQICVGGVWGTVCGDGFGTLDAQVICRQLGFGTRGIEAYSNASFGIVSGPVHLDNVDCSGDESSLLNCTYSSKRNFTPIAYAGVACSELCTPEGDVRLVGGTGDHEGRIEICSSGVWSTVCDDFWGFLDAQVVCRQLGYLNAGGSLTFSSAYFGQGTGPSYSFHCSGTESSLLDCIHVKQNNCSHNADAGVRCQVTNTSCLEGNVRLVDGQNQYEGRVEICLNNVWGSVCDDGLCTSYTGVVCRQLGYGMNVHHPFPRSFPAQRPILISNVNCLGPENALIQCSYNTRRGACLPGLIQCSRNSRLDACLQDLYTAGVTCGPPDNCTEGELRLVVVGHNLKANTEGRLEICLEGQWGSICANYWDSLDAQVACRQLGYAPTGSTSFTYYGHPHKFSAIHFNDVHCTGTEASLLQCPYNTVHSNCAHYNTVGVSCLEIALVVTLLNGSPRVSGDNVTAEFSTNKNVMMIQCRLGHGVTEFKDCSSGSVSYTGLAGEEVNEFVLHIQARTTAGEVANLRRMFRIERPQHCSVHLVNGGSVVNGTNVTADFSGNGPIAFYTCFLNGRVFMERCTSPVTFPNLSHGRHVFKITPFGCGTNRSPVTFFADIGSFTEPEICRVSMTRPIAVQGNRVTLHFRGSGPYQSFTCYVDRGGRVVRNCNSPFEVSGLAPGKHFIKIRPEGLGCNPWPNRQSMRIDFSVV